MIKNLMARYRRARRIQAMLRSGVLRFAGQSVYFSPGGNYTAKALLTSGDYEPDCAAAFKMSVRPATTVFDVGANIGVSALQILGSQSDIRVVSFEASPTVLPYLTRTHDICPDRNRWQIVNKAVCEEAGGKTTFHVNRAGNDEFDGLRNTCRVSGGTPIEVMTTTLDHEWLKLGEPVVSLIKIDVEGAESLVLKGAAGLIESQRPVIVTEWFEGNFSAYGVRPEWILEFARSTQYHVYLMPEITPADPLAFRFQLAGRYNLLLLP